MMMYTISSFLVWFGAQATLVSEKVVEFPLRG